MMDYEWHPAKSATNKIKHGILFADAVGVFEDEDALSREDPAALREHRFVVTGLDTLGCLLTVVYTERSSRIRLISARRATKKEAEAYARHR